MSGRRGELGLEARGDLTARQRRLVFEEDAQGRRRDRRDQDSGPGDAAGETDAVRRKRDSGAELTEPRDSAPGTVDGGERDTETAERDAEQSTQQPRRDSGAELTEPRETAPGMADGSGDSDTEPAGRETADGGQSADRPRQDSGAELTDPRDSAPGRTIPEGQIGDAVEPIPVDAAAGQNGRRDPGAKLTEPRQESPGASQPSEVPGRHAELADQEPIDRPYRTFIEPPTATDPSGETPDDDLNPQDFQVSPPDNTPPSVETGDFQGQETRTDITAEDPLDTSPGVGEPVADVVTNSPAAVKPAAAAAEQGVDVATDTAESVVDEAPDAAAAGYRESVVWTGTAIQEAGDVAGDVIDPLVPSDPNLRERADPVVDVTESLIAANIAMTRQNLELAAQAGEAAYEGAATAEDEIADRTPIDEFLGGAGDVAGDVLGGIDDRVVEPIQSGAGEVASASDAAAEWTVDEIVEPAAEEAQFVGTFPTGTATPGETVTTGEDNEAAEQFATAVGTGAAEVTVGAPQTARIVSEPGEVAGDVRDVSDKATQRIVEDAIQPGAEQTQLTATFGIAPVGGAGTITTGQDNPAKTRVVEGVATGLTERTVGFPRDVVDIGAGAAGAAGYTAAEIGESGVVEGSGSAAETGGEVAAETAGETVDVVRENPVYASGLLLGSVGGLGTQSFTLGVAGPRAIRRLRGYSSTAGGQKIDLEGAGQPQVVQGDEKFPPATDRQLYQENPPAQVRQQSEEFTPESIRQQFEEAGVEGTDLVKTLDVEPEGPGTGRAAQGFTATPDETGIDPDEITPAMVGDKNAGPFTYENPGGFVAPEISPHFLRVESPEREFSMRPGLPSLGSQPTAIYLRTEVRAPDADDQLEFAREMTRREGETDAFTKPPSEVALSEIEAVVPPGAEFVDVGTGPLRNTLRRVGIGSDFYTEVDGQRVPIRTVAPESELPSTTLRDRVRQFLGDERAQAGSTSGDTAPIRVSRDISRGDYDPGVDRPTPPVAAPSSTASDVGSGRGEQREVDSRSMLSPAENRPPGSDSRSTITRDDRSFLSPSDSGYSPPGESDTDGGESYPEPGDSSGGPSGGPGDGSYLTPGDSSTGGSSMPPPPPSIPPSTPPPPPPNTPGTPPPPPPRLPDSDDDDDGEEFLYPELAETAASQINPIERLGRPGNDSPGGGDPPWL